jgi:hypothetical protein
MAGFHFIDPTKGFEDARSAALKAIELSPEGSEGHRALAKILSCTIGTGNAPKRKLNKR